MDLFLGVEITSRGEHAKKLLVALADDARAEAPDLAISVGFVVQALDRLLGLTSPTTLPEDDAPQLGTTTCKVSVLEGLPKGTVQRWLADTRSVAQSLCELLVLADGRTSEAEFVLLRTAVGHVVGYLYTEVEEPLWAAFPDLVPVEMKTEKAPVVNNAGQVGGVK